MHIILPSHTSSLSRLNRILRGNSYNEARFFILVDENSYTHCLPRFVSSVERLQESDFLEVPVGEKCKNIAIATQLWQTLLEDDADRNSILVTLGGGCVSDLGGFVAASYKRGIRTIHVPTTLVGMIDAAIGGKSALNFEEYKNPLGFFHNPDILCIEPTFLDTLPDQELLSGTFEMLKTFLIGDPSRYIQLCDKLLQGSINIIPDMISACAEIKLAVVRRDPHDHNIRHILNLGHTFGHAIESYSHKQSTPLSHGFAIGIGIICAMYLSVKKLGFPSEELVRYRSVVKKITPLPHYTLHDTEAILGYIRHDKKNTQNCINCVLLQALGAPVIDLAVGENEIRDALLALDQ